MIFIVTKTKVGERQIKRWNKSKPAGHPEITLESKRKDIEFAINRYIKGLPGVSPETNVPVVFVDSFAVDEDEIDEYKKDELAIFNSEAAKLVRFLVYNEQPLPFAETILKKVRAYFEDSVTIVSEGKE